VANHWPVLFCFTATLVGHGAIANVKTIGFRDRDRVSTTPGNPGNLLEFDWPFWKFLCKMLKINRIGFQYGYQIAYLRNCSPYFIFAAAPC